jgi:hypothetical protein
MGTSKIVRLVALLIAVVAAFLDLPEEAAIVALAGLAPWRWPWCTERCNRSGEWART